MGNAENQPTRVGSAAQAAPHERQLTAGEPGALPTWRHPLSAPTSPQVLDRPQPSAPEPTTTRGRIVVGVDGSSHSVDALRWALRQALASDAAIEVVTSWCWPSYAYGYAPLPDIDLATPMGEAAKAAVALALAGVEGAGAVPLATHLVEGDPATVLLDHAKGADVLVVASRGHGTLAGLLLGSVGLHCVSHATCPVLVVRGETAHGDKE